MKIIFKIGYQCFIAHNATIQDINVLHNLQRIEQISYDENAPIKIERDVASNFTILQDNDHRLNPPVLPSHINEKITSLEADVATRTRWWNEEKEKLAVANAKIKALENN